MITFDDNVSGGQTFFCLLGYVEGDIWQQKGSNPQNLFLLVSPMCQDTPCKILGLYGHLCSCSTLIFTITSFRQKLFPKRVFFGPWDQTGPSWGWSLSTCDGPRYKIIGNNSEKKVAKNILRSGPGSWPRWGLVCSCPEYQQSSSSSLPSSHQCNWRRLPVVRESQKHSREREPWSRRMDLMGCILCQHHRGYFTSPIQIIHVATVHRALYQPHYGLACNESPQTNNQLP